MQLPAQIDASVAHYNHPPSHFLPSRPRDGARMERVEKYAVGINLAIIAAAEDAAPDDGTLSSL